MTHVTKEEALNYHIGGKIEIKVKTPCETSRDLSMAYTPGVAEPCREINADTELATNTQIKQIWWLSSLMARLFLDLVTSALSLVASYGGQGGAI